MPLLILSVGITEPPVARRAVDSRWVVAGRIAGRDALTQTLQVLALAFLFYNGHDTPRAAILRPLVCTEGTEGTSRDWR